MNHHQLVELQILHVQVLPPGTPPHLQCRPSALLIQGYRTAFTPQGPENPDDPVNPDLVDPVDPENPDNPDPDDPVDPENPDQSLIVERNDAAVDAWFAQFSDSEGSRYKPGTTPEDTSGSSSSSEDEPPPPKKPRVEPKVLHRDPQRVARRRQQEIHKPPLITPTKSKPTGGKQKKDEPTAEGSATGRGNTVASNSYWHRWKNERELGRVESMHTSKRGYFQPKSDEKKKMSLFDMYRKEVKHYQTNQEPVIPVRPFIRAVRWITTDVINRMYDPTVGTYPPEEKHMFRFQAEAYHALLEATEAYLSGHLMGAWWCARHAGRSTLMDKDIWLECKMRGITKIGDKWDDWVDHGTILDAGQPNLSDEVTYRDYPRAGPVYEKPGRAFFNAKVHNVLRFPKRERKRKPKKRSSNKS